jgi:hypothetical protein
MKPGPSSKQTTILESQIIQGIQHASLNSAVRFDQMPQPVVAPAAMIHIARVSHAIEIEPRLIEQLFDLDAARMHLMALALAHMEPTGPR